MCIAHTRRHSITFNCRRKIYLIVCFFGSSRFKFVFVLTSCDFFFFLFLHLWYINDSPVSHNYSWDYMSLSYEKTPCLIINESACWSPMTASSCEISCSKWEMHEWIINNVFLQFLQFFFHRPLNVQHKRNSSTQWV